MATAVADNNETGRNRNMSSGKYGSGLDAQINDYLLSASGHLTESARPAGGRSAVAFGAAASSALVMMSQAEAAVVVNGGSAVPVSVVNGAGTTSISGIPMGRRLDVDGNGVFDFAIWGYSTNGNVGMAAGNGNAYMIGGGSDDLLKLSAGATIGPARPAGSWTQSVMGTGNDIAFSVGNGANNWSGGVPEFGFVGVRFVNASGTHYGWVCLRSEPTVPSGITAVAYAFESVANTMIQAGDTGAGGIRACDASLAAIARPVPVMGPVAYGLTALALGALGLGGLRRRRGERKPAGGAAH